MKKKLLGGLLAITTITAMGVAGVGLIENPILLRADSTEKTCCSIHFGMNDSNYKGQVKGGNSGSIAVGSHTDTFGIIDGITLQSYEVKGNPLACIENKSFKTHKENSTLILNFDNYVESCDIYAVAGGADTAYIKIDNVTSEAIHQESGISGQSGEITVTYPKYHFTFDATNSLAIDFTKRIFVGDIAFKISSYIPTKYTVSFDGNGGSGTMSSVEKNENSFYELPANQFTAPSGKEFDAGEVDSIRKNPHDMITITKNIVVKALGKDLPIGSTTITIKPDGSATSASSCGINADPVSIAISSGIINYTQIRIYKNQTLIITGTDATITKIEFTCTASGTAQYGPGCFAALEGYSYSGTKGTWTGNANSITFTASSNQVRITEIKVTYIPNN